MPRNAVAKTLAEPNTTPEYTQLQDMLRNGIEHNRPLMREIYLNLAFLAGYQWVAVEVSGEIVPIKSNQITEFENKILDIYLWRQGYTFKTRPVPVLHAGGIDIGDMESANVGSKLSDYWYFTCNGESAAKEAWGWMQLAGIAWISPVFTVDPFVKVKRTRKEYSEEPLETLGPTGQRQISYVKDVEEEDEASEVDYQVYTPMNTHCFPLTADKWRDVEQVIHCDIVTKEWIEEHLGSELVKKKVDWSKISPIQPDELDVALIERVNRFVAPGFNLMQDHSHTVDRYLLLKSKKRPTTGHDKGEYKIYVGTQEVYSDTLPHIDWAREVDPTNNLNLTMGLVPHRAPGPPGRLIPSSPIGRLIQPQVSYNRMLTAIARNRATVGVSKIIVAEGSLNKDSYTDEFGEILEINPAFWDKKPHMIEGKPLPNAELELEMYRRRFENESGRTGAMGGKNPPQVRSAQHLDIIVEEGQVRQIAAVREMERTSEQLFWLTAAMAREKYTTEKIFAIYGAGGMGEAMQFIKCNLRQDLRISAGSAMPRNKAVQEALIVEAFRYGMFRNPETGVDDTDTVMEMIRLGKLNPHVNFRRLVAFNAKNESLRIMHGEIMEPLPGEDDALHEKAHMEFEARSEYRSASEEAKVAHQWHRSLHQERLAQLSPEVALQTAQEESGEQPGSGFAAPGEGAPGVPEAAEF